MAEVKKAAPTEEKPHKSEPLVKEVAPQFDYGFDPKENRSLPLLLRSLPGHVFSPSSWRATKRLILTAAFSFFSFHALTISPIWALPFFWVFAGLALSLLFDLGIDASSGNLYTNQFVNDLLSSFYLAPLLQPYEFWKTAKVTSKSFLSAAWTWSLKRSKSKIPISLVIVIIFALVFFPYMIYTVGFWGLVKLWLIPFIIFYIGMGEFIAAGSQIEQLAENSDVKKSSTPRGSAFSFFTLRSYLRFQLRVPSYRLDTAVDVAQRMMQRASLDASDGTPAVNVAQNSNASSSASSPSFLQQFVENPQFGSLRLGYERFLDSAFSLAIIPCGALWFYCLSQTPMWPNVFSLFQVAMNHVLQVVGLVFLTVMTAFPESVSGYFFGEDFAAELSSQAAAAESKTSNSLTKVAIDGWAKFSQHALSYSNLAVVSVIFLLLWLFRSWNVRSRRSVYLVDFTTFTPPDSWLITTESFKTLQRAFPFSEQSLSFMDKLVDRTGLGEKTYFPPGTMAKPPQLTLPMARLEAETVIFSCLDQLFAVTGTKPKDIDILVVNCSLFCPTPSLSSVIVNKYKMRENIQSYNLGGMGCSAGVISIHLAKDLLQVYPNSTALVVSTENITQNWYRGNQRNMLLPNTLFRVGGAAVLLSNKSSYSSRSKFTLRHTVRTHRGGDNESYHAVYQDTDEDGYIGVKLEKSLMQVAGTALTRNITTLGPLILPWSEQINYFINLIRRKGLKQKIPAYVPDFSKAVQHFCIHAGGRAVIEAITNALKLKPEHVAASKAVLHRYGNTSSSSIWYELAYLEKKGQIKRGDKIWQIAFGSGFKCNSAIWEAL